MVVTFFTHIFHTISNLFLKQFSKEKFDKFLCALRVWVVDLKERVKGQRIHE